MKKVLAIVFSLAFVCAIAQERPFTGAKTVTHGPLACPSLVMTPVDGTVITKEDLVETILGTGISYSNVALLGYTSTTDASAGMYVGGMDAGLGIEQGIVLSSGYIANAVGPNSNDGISVGLGLPGDADLTAQAVQTTFDATVLEFDFVPDFDQLYIQFVFGSDEYNEYVFSYNDVFAFYLNDVNIALVPSTTNPVSINNINLSTNNIYYKNNDYSDLFPGPYPYCNEMDGFTTVMVATGAVTADAVNHIKLAIADGGDSALDSWVFIKAEGFSGVDPEVPVSNWALFIGIALILAFAIIRFRRLV